MEFNIQSSTLIPLLSLPLFVFIFLKSLIQTKNSKSANPSFSHIPGPKPLPLIGNLHQMQPAAAPHRTFRDLAAKHGPLMHLQLGEIHILIISSVDLAKQVTKVHDVNFANRPPGLVPAALGYNYTDIVFSPYGGYWRQLRKICTLELLSARRVQTFRPLRVEENMNLARSIASGEGSPANLSEKIHLLSYDIITRAAVGEKTAARAAVTSVIEQATKLGSGFMIADLYPSVRLLPLISGARFKIGRMRRDLDRLFDGIIEQHRIKGAAQNGDGAFEDLVDVLLKIQADATEMPLTNQNIKAVLVDIFVAGTDTSSTAVEWAMSEMIRNPEILNKAQEEVRKVFDDKGYIDDKKFEELKYLKLIIKETLRLHPPVPLLVPRMSTERCEINGYEIPTKSRVIVNAWALGRDPEYWNEPEEFKPERFEESSIDFKGNNLEFIPFGAGRRMCPGMWFGLANVEFSLAMLLYHFDWEMPFGMKNKDLDMTEAFGATLTRKNHLCLIPVVKRPLPAAAATAVV